MPRRIVGRREVEKHIVKQRYTNTYRYIVALRRLGAILAHPKTSRRRAAVILGSLLELSGGQKPFECDASRSLLECLLEAFRWPLGLTGGLGCLGDHVEASWGSLGSLLEASWAPLGAAWTPLGAILGRSWRLQGRSWSHLGGDRSKKGGSLISVAPREPPKSLLGALFWRSWSALGRSWGRLGALLGPSWGHLGAI